MTKTDSSQPTPDPTKATGCLEALVRIFWLLIGNFVLFFLAVSIAIHKNRIAYDFAYWIMAVVLIGIRLLDIKKFAGETADNEPATMTHWRKYSIQILLFAIFGYILAKGLSYLNLL